MTDSRLPSPEQLERACDILKAVAHPVRLKIIDLLQSGARTVTDIARVLEIQQPYASQQLTLMKSRGVLSSRRDGNQVFYAVANPDVIKIVHCVCGRESPKDTAATEDAGRTAIRP